MLRGTYTLDSDGIDKVHASEEMESVLSVLKIPLSTKTKDTTPMMGMGMDLETYKKQLLPLHLVYIMAIIMQLTRAKFQHWLT